MRAKAEGPYDPGRTDGIDALVTSLRANGIKPGSNVYAELGSTWRFLMRDPDSAAHGLGKLLKHCGEANVLWGTDSIWYGSPQDQIQAFRTFQISPELREKHGYPEITPALRAKVFGLNALKVYSIPAGRAEEAREGSGRAGAGRVSERGRPHVPDARAADAAGVPEPQGVGRLTLRGTNCCAARPGLGRGSGCTNAG